MTYILSHTAGGGRPAGFATLAGAALLLVVVADMLLFDGPIGISLAVFLALVAIASAVANPAPTGRSTTAALVLLAGLAPLAENVSSLSITVAVLALGAVALTLAGRLSAAPSRIAERLLAFVLAAPLRFAGDILARKRAAARRARRRGSLSALVGWIVPVGLAPVFVALFALANPVVDRWLQLIDLSALLDPVRLLFWTATFLGVWPFLRPRFRSFPRAATRRAPLQDPPVAAVASPRMSDALAKQMFGRVAILRALVVFNTIFAIETGLDAAYLWGGVALPDGMTYAAYAHRGAYPLVATALIAAAFVLLAMRAGSEASTDRRVRLLVYLWITQNVALVLSSILRLDLYVGVYSLTYWRVAAFVWMGLVAGGLLLIVVRIALDRPNRWLVGANLTALAAVLYGCCFVDIADLVAGYNVRHSAEATGEGYELDVG